MADFLGGDYVRDDPRRGGCSVRLARNRYEASTLSQRLANSIEDAARFDIDIVLRGDESMRRRFFAHLIEHDIVKRFTIAVPQDPAITVPTASAKVRTKAAAGDSILKLYSGAAGEETLQVGTLFALAGGERLYMVTGSDDHVLPTTGSVDVSIVPALDAAATTTATLDFTPAVPVKHSADSNFAVSWDETGSVVIRFTVRNDA